MFANERLYSDSKERERERERGSTEEEEEEEEEEEVVVSSSRIVLFKRKKDFRGGWVTLRDTDDFTTLCVEEEEYRCRRL